MWARTAQRWPGHSVDVQAGRRPVFFPTTPSENSSAQGDGHAQRTSSSSRLIVKVPSSAADFAPTLDWKGRLDQVLCEREDCGLLADPDPSTHREAVCADPASGYETPLRMCTSGA